MTESRGTIPPEPPRPSQARCAICLPGGGLTGALYQIGALAALQDVARVNASGAMHVLVLEPEPTDVLLFLHNPVSFTARRAILEYAYRTTRERIARWIERNRAVVERFGWSAA